MPKLSVVKPAELIVALEKLGFVKHRQSRGSHVVMIHVQDRRKSLDGHYNVYPQFPVAAIGFIFSTACYNNRNSRISSSRYLLSLLIHLLII